MIKCAVENCPNFFHKKCVPDLNKTLPD
jgi:hypothetical protein